MDRESLTEHLGVSWSKSTFFNQAKTGVIAKARVRGLYLLNETRVRLGMDPLDSIAVNRLRKERSATRQDEPTDFLRQEATDRQILFMVFAAMEPAFLDLYPWDIWPEDFSEREWGKVEAFSHIHKQPMAGLSEAEAVLYALKLMKEKEVEELSLQGR